jgi:hypothetical protein
MNKICWNCKFFTHTGGHGSSDWGCCNLSHDYVDSEDTCEKFADKELDNKITPVKVEIVKRKSAVDETKSVFMVHVYDNKGELIDVTGFKTENLAGRYAFEMEQYYKFLKKD